MDIIKYVSDEALILIPVMYVIGMILKSTPKVKDWLIPYILLVVGILGAIALLGISVKSVIQGILVTGATVYTNQLIKQTQNRN
jgi:hypothetical protein